MSGFAPIAIFVYKRPSHTRRMLESLTQNIEIAESPVFVFCDGPRSNNDQADVAATRDVVKHYAPAHATIVEREENYGLARSIIAGVTHLTKTYGKTIVIEDDLVLSPQVLKYFNRALELYEQEERVMHVSAYMFPVQAALPETFFYREATCWGWATWARAWAKFEPNSKILLDHVQTANTQFEFDVRNSMGFVEMLRRQDQGLLDSWAIRWYASMRMYQGLALHPYKSLVKNMGFDGTGVHCSITQAFDVTLSEQEISYFPTVIAESQEALRAMITYRRGSITHRAKVLDRIKHITKSALWRMAHRRL